MYIYLSICVNSQVCVCVYIHAYTMLEIPAEIIRGHQLPCNWSYRWLWAIMLVLGTEPSSSARQ